jgi:transposase
MYFKKIKGTNAEYLYLVESYRDKDGSPPKHRTLLSLGKIEDLKEAQLQNMVKMLTGLCKNNSIVDLNITDEIARKNWGIPKIIDKLWEYFKLNSLFQDVILKNRKIKYDLNNIIKLMLADRFHKPCSKYKSYLHKEYYEKTSDIKLHNIYKSLNELCEHKILIEKHLFEQSSKKLDLTLDLILFDVTTLYFESAKQDELRKFGYSKDAKFNDVQIVLSLLVNRDGCPVGVDIFPGNTYEGHTLITGIKKLKNTYKLNKIIIVADRGINSSQNLFVMQEEAKIHYVVSSRIKKLPKELQQQILELDNYHVMDSSNPDNVFKYKIIDFTKKISTNSKYPLITKEVSFPSKLICTWSTKRARKDCIDRERLVNKAKNIISYGDSSDSRGAKKYLKTINNKKELNKNKITEDEKWDGFYAIETNDINLSTQEILSAYSSLWKIEESFRLLKSHLDIRPIHHWTEERIIGHCMISYIAFFFERTLEIMLKNNNLILGTPLNIRESINKMEFSSLAYANKEHKIYGKIDILGLKILELLNIDIPKKVLIEH